MPACWRRPARTTMSDGPTSGSPHGQGSPPGNPVDSLIAELSAYIAGARGRWARFIERRKDDPGRADEELPELDSRVLLAHERLDDLEDLLTTGHQPTQVAPCEDRPLPPGEHPRDQWAQTKNPIDFQIERLHTYVDWAGECLAAFAERRHTGPRRAEEDLHEADRCLCRASEHLARMRELLGVGYRPTQVRPGSAEAVSARLEGETLVVDWAGSPRRLFDCLADAQRRAGGPNAVRTVKGQASRWLVGNAGWLDLRPLAREIGRALGGTWHVAVVDEPAGHFLVATRTGGPPPTEPTPPAPSAPSA